jgi:hypothetical protein
MLGFLSNMEPWQQAAAVVAVLGLMAVVLYVALGLDEVRG